MLIANTDIEAKQLVNLYDADPTRVEVVHPGVDLDVFRPVGQAAARARLGLPGRARGDVRRAHPAAQGSRRAAARGLGAARARPVPAPQPGGPRGRRPLRHRPRAPRVARAARRRPRPRRRGALRAAGRAVHAGRLVRRGQRGRACRRTTSRSGWSPSRHRPPAPRSWPPPWAGCRPSSATACPACSSRGTTRRLRPVDRAGARRRRPTARGCPAARSSRPRASPGSAPPTARSTSTGRPRHAARPRGPGMTDQGARAPMAAGPTARTERPTAARRARRDPPRGSTPTSWSGRRSRTGSSPSCSPARRSSDAVPLRRRLARARGARLRRPPPRREPRAGLPLAARAEPQDVRRRLRRRPHGRHLPRRPAAALVGLAGRGRPAARRGADLRRRVVQHDPRARVRLVDPQGVGVAALAGESTKNLEAFRGWLDRPAEGTGPATP